MEEGVSEVEGHTWLYIEVKFQSFDNHCLCEHWCALGFVVQFFGLGACPVKQWLEYKRSLLLHFLLSDDIAAFLIIFISSVTFLPSEPRTIGIVQIRPV